ncbi:MAG: hypothetical protein HAW67_04340 [Endozoicomonadaceae bacterium]|nr:hypothetical protein [Endozoicomonadaceae bacterium]
MISESIDETGMTEQETAQLALFEMLDTDETNSISLEHKYSNSITRIDLIPRFFRGKGARVALDSPKRIEHYINRFTIKGEEYFSTVTPAVVDVRVKGQGFVPMSCLPGDVEETIERILFLLASSKGLEKNRIGGNTRYGISFSIYEVHTALKKMGKEKSYEQISTSLRIIRDSRTLITKVNINNPKKRTEMTQDIWADAVFEVEGKGKARDKCYIAFSDFVVEEILKLNYRQVLFSRFVSYSSALSRFLDLYLMHMWTNAEVATKKQVSMNIIMESFGKANKSVVTKRRDMYEAIDDLVERGVLVSRTNAIKKKNIEGVEDYLFHVEPTKKFVDEIIKANKKNKGLRSLKQLQMSTVEAYD